MVNHLTTCDLKNLAWLYVGQVGFEPIAVRALVIVNTHKIPPQGIAVWDMYSHWRVIDDSSHVMVQLPCIFFQVSAVQHG